MMRGWERNWGEFDGKPDSLFPEKWLVDSEMPDCVETVDEIILRLKPFYQEISKLHKNKTVLVVAHNGIGRISRCLFQGMPKSRDLNEYTLKNAEVYKLTDWL